MRDQGDRNPTPEEGPTTYALCQKPVIGIAMFVASLCVFPPLILNEPLSLTTAGATAAKEFVATVDKSYLFDLAFEFPSIEAMKRDGVVGTGYSGVCDDAVKYEDIATVRREDLGRPVPIRVSIKRKSDGRVVVDQTFVSLCTFGSSGSEHPTKWRKIGRVELTRGKYLVEVTNLEAQAGLDGVATSFSLVGGHGK